MVSRVVADSTSARVFCPYELRELVKTFPGRKWRPDEKCWTVGLSTVDALADALRAVGETVFVTRADGTPWTSGRAEHGHRAAPSSSWAESLLGAVGPERADAVFRALSRVLHPDAGGDTALMQQLNAARTRGGAA